MLKSTSLPGVLIAIENFVNQSHRLANERCVYYWYLINVKHSQIPNRRPEDSSDVG